jgi:hypothetical protein
MYSKYFKMPFTIERSQHYDLTESSFSKLSMSAVGWWFSAGHDVGLQVHCDLAPHRAVDMI